MRVARKIQIRLPIIITKMSLLFIIGKRKACFHKMKSIRIIVVFKTLKMRKMKTRVLFTQGLSKIFWETATRQREKTSIL